jgi:DNA-binding NarL/FixJ family response regulator
VLVVGDQVLIRAGLAALIHGAPGLEVVGQVTGGEAVAQVLARRPDVVLVDVHLPGLNGAAAIERIVFQASGHHRRVLILTTLDVDEHIEAALRAGACGVLPKDTPPERLLSAIRFVAAGNGLFAPNVTRRLINAYIHHTQPHWDPPPDLQPLTGREIEVLRLVALGMSNMDIAGHLAVSEATVKTHLNRTMAKLNLASRAQAVVIAYETGLVAPRHAMHRAIPV